MFRKMPIILLAVIIATIFLDDFIPFQMKSFFYALSLSIKSVIIFILPAIIFMLLFKTTSQLARNATKMIILILAGVCVSNFISTMISYQIGKAIHTMDLSIALPSDTEGLTPLWLFSLPKLLSNGIAMFSGLALGIICSLLAPNVAAKISGIFEKWVGAVLKFVIYLIPIFIIGFIVKLIHDKVMENILRDYALIFTLVALAVFGYIASVFLVSERFQFSSFIKRIRNMMPAAIAGFGSMSSAAAMPLTIVGAEKNSTNLNLTRLVIPTTVNIHLIGDCFAIPIFAFAVLKNFGVEDPAFLSYLTFACYFVIAKFSVAAIPGGGIIVMLPILENYLGFTAEMASLITALYILFDPVITSANIMGNGAFALASNKLQAFFTKRKTEISASPIAEVLD